MPDNHFDGLLFELFVLAGFLVGFGQLTFYCARHLLRDYYEFLEWQKRQKTEARREPRPRLRRRARPARTSRASAQATKGSAEGDASSKTNPDASA